MCVYCIMQNSKTTSNFCLDVDMQDARRLKQSNVFFYTYNDKSKHKSNNKRNGI